MIAWMYPGQGSQRAAMASELSPCAELLEVAGRLIGANLKRICTTSGITDWPPDLLQPAIYVTSVGASEALKQRGLSPGAVVGHSLGEFAGLVAGGSIDFEDGLRLVATRGRAMVQVSRRSPGGMAAVIGLEPSLIEEICAATGDVWVANFNTPKQTVISGREEPLAQAAEECRRQGADRVVRLNVPVAAHTPLMEPAAEALAAEFEGLTVRPPISPYWSPVDARAHTDPDEIKELLVRAVTVAVRFAATITAMNEQGSDGFVEVGPARVLTGLVRQVLPGVRMASVGTDAEAEALAFAAADLETTGTSPRTASPGATS